MFDRIAIEIAEILALLLFMLYIYWRFFYFFRDPERKVPEGRNIVSAADGTVVYIKIVRKGEIPVSVKGQTAIRLEEVIRKSPIKDFQTLYHVGVFMHPTSVHVNRAPLDGRVENIQYYSGKNLPMTLMWMRVLFEKKPYEKNSNHVYANERNIITIVGAIPLVVIQIADIYVKKILCNLRVGDIVKKGQRIGAIKMGSQVDILFPLIPGVRVLIKEGEKVFAGESVIATTNYDK